MAGSVAKPLGERLMKHVLMEPNSGCWLWIGGVNERGYGIVGAGPRGQGVMKAHRASWLVHRGPLQPGDCVLHKCDTPACIRPDHLFIGTLKDNSRDCVRKGRNFIPDNRGERATWRRLNAEQAREVWAAKQGKRKGTGTDLARRFGVHKSTIYQIWRGNNWASTLRS